MLKEYDSQTLKRLQMAELDILKVFDRTCEKYGINYFLDWGSLIGAVRHGGFIPWDDDMDVSMTRKDYEKFKKIFASELSKDYILATPIFHKGYCGVVIKLMRKHTKFVPEFSKEMKCELGIHIDIFVWDNLCDSKVSMNIQLIGTRIFSYLIFLCGSSNPEISGNGLLKVILQKVCKMMHFILSRIPRCENFFYRCFEKVSKMGNRKTTRRVATFQTPNILKYAFNKDALEPYHRIEFEGCKVSVTNNYKEHLQQSYGDYMKLPPKDQRENHCAYMVDFGGMY